MGISAGQGVPSLRPGVCTSTTRPTNPFEGQMIYETDTDMLALWNGSAWRYIAATTPTNGSVLQVVSQTYDTAASASLTSSPSDISGMSVSITPKSTSSKVLVSTVLNVSADVSVNNVALRMMRDSTVIFSGASPGSRANGMALVGTSNQYLVECISGTHLDSPASTSALTYKIQWWSTNGSGSAYINRSKDDADNQYRPRMASSITVMEIAG